MILCLSFSIIHYSGFPRSLCYIFLPTHYFYAKIVLMKRYAFHQWTLADVERHFKVSIKEGLSNKEVTFRLQKNGKNALTEIKEISWLTVLFRQFTNFLTILLVVADLLSLLSEGLSYFYILTAIIVFNVAVGFYQELKAEKSLKALKNSLSYKAKVLRDGEVVEILSEDLVVGDVVYLTDGDRVPADLRLVWSEGLRVDESTLTGESTPVSKKTKNLSLDVPLAERANMTFSGTTVYAGRAHGVVVSVGKETEFGHIAEMISENEEKTPLEKRILSIGKTLTFIAVVAVVIIFIIGLYRGWDVYELLTYVIAVLVAAVPESLPTVITLALALGVMGMVKKKAIVRKLSVIEALGSVRVIATDKTGTLTQNKLSVEEIAVYQNKNFIDYKKSGSKEKVKIEALLYKSAICSSAEGEDLGKFVGDPLEVAIYEALIRKNKKLLIKSRGHQIINQTPFDSDKKYMMVQVENGNNKLIVIKGAVEKVVGFCDLTAKEKGIISGKVHELAEKGLRIIGVCEKKVTSRSVGGLKNMKFLGIVAFWDEPAEGIKEAMKATYAAGIWPVIITGDDAKTAKYVANSVGLKVADDEVLEGKNLEKLTDSALRKKLHFESGGIKIVARATPKDKTRVVKTYEDMGFSVAVTGDGVNDSPALKSATVGIAMGIRGSDVSKEVADIVLTDDNYGTIITAIAWGRKIYDNIKNSLIFLLSGNFDELFLIVIAFLLNLPAPLTAIQILWINLVTESFMAIALAFESPTSAIMKEKPRSSKTGSFASSMHYAISLGGVAFVASIFLYFWGLGDSIAKARTLVFLMAILSVIVFSFSIRAPKRIWQDFKGFFGNKYLNVAVIFSILVQVFVFIPQTKHVFQTTSLNQGEWIALSISVLVLFILAEFFRIFFDKKNSKNF